MKNVFRVAIVAMLATAPALAQAPGVGSSKDAVRPNVLQARGGHTEFVNLSGVRLARPSILLAQTEAAHSQCLPSSAGDADNDASVFVVRDGFVFERIPGTHLELPMPGGGASGCIDPDWVQRGYTAADLGLAYPQLYCDLAGTPVPAPN